MPGIDLSWLSLADANARWVMTGTALLGLAAGVLGAFALLRRRSLMGDTLAHAALPGIAIAFLLTGSKSIGPLLVGAALAGITGTLCLSAITRYSKIKEDTAMAIVLTVFFGLGIMLLNVIQRMPGGNQSGLDKFLFGQAASLVGRDVQVMVVIAALLCLAVALLFKEFKLLAFDRGFGQGIGLPVGWLDQLLNLMIVLAVVIGLESVGVVLMAAMLITPAIAARYWTDRLAVMVLLSGLFGALSGVLGTIASQAGPRMPTGPLIVLAATAVFLLSLLFAPRRGLLARLIQFARNRRRIARERALRALYELAEEAGAAGAAFTPAELERRRGLPARSLAAVLAGLQRDGLVSAGPAGWSLTGPGLQEAYRLVREERLFELFLMHEAELGGHPVDRDGRGPTFPPGAREALEELLKLHQLEPRLLPDPLLKGVL
ncbi:MAG: metal ABC transporter permease [Bacillota bacterium]